MPQLAQVHPQLEQAQLVQRQRGTAVATGLGGPFVAISLALFVFVYCVVFTAGILLINRLIAKGPDEISPEDPPEQPSKRTLKAAQGPASHLFGDGKPGDDKIQPAL